MKGIDQLGAFQRHDDNIDVRFERYYPRSIDRVWSALTQPERLQDWMGASRIEPHIGGQIDLMTDGSAPMTGHILVWDPPRILEFTWSNAHAPNSVIRYELEGDGDGTRLIFTHQGMPYATSALMLPGWHFFLSQLGAALCDTEQQTPDRSWREMQEIYVEHYKLHGVALDPSFRFH